MNDCSLSCCSAFNIGYVITNLCAGYLAACYGPKHTLTYGVVIWSTFTIITPLAAASKGLWVLLLVRALMGFGEGVAFPCMQVLIKTWVPGDRRTRALGLVYSGEDPAVVSSCATPCAPFPSLVAVMQPTVPWPALLLLASAGTLHTGHQHPLRVISVCTLCSFPCQADMCHWPYGIVEGLKLPEQQPSLIDTLCILNTQGFVGNMH